MSSIRIKVQINDNKSVNKNSSRKSSPSVIKFIYVLNSPSTTTINELIHLLENYLIRQFSIKNIRIIQLMTDDGYILSNNDLCSIVLNDNDRIICYDMEQFVEDNYSTLDLNNLWSEIKQYDASDNREKTIQIGLNNLEKLFIRIYGNSDGYGLYIFNIFELMKIANEKSQNNIIGRVGNTQWFIEAKWEYDINSDTNLFLIYNLKVASSEQIWSNKLHLLLDESRMCIEKGEIICLSEINDDNILTEQQREYLNELATKIPPIKQIGPQIDVNKDADKKITKHECEGDSLVRMAYGARNTVTAYQESYSSEEGTFRQHFVITHINFSKKSGDKPILVTNLTVHYQTNDGSWCECEDIAIGSITLRDQEPCWLADLAIEIESDKLVSYGIKGWMRVPGKAGKDNFTRRRIHKNLPQPFKLKIILTDNSNKQSSLIVEQLNKPLEYETSESFLKYNQSSIDNLLGFIYADDCENDERISMGIYLNKEYELVINSQNSCVSLNRKAIRSMEYKAKQDNTPEILFDSIHHQYETQEKKAIALFDSENFILYAVRFEISTKTSKTEQTVLLPIEQIK
ncbi:unnamed protein product [Adineta steineri]|uniref:Uncharacterized protein n=1 Tax=Adineta steineri TaxID=433720 RepID=A0A813PXF9_9BILA|nr:unnamed protein product [Adineta steineri]CAF0796510.1 unnamed protein product [Adineta steineri]CAF3715266.1 unnamed protein product [Adineta steineri]CAF3893877.1 unnamed protein product [Adineta steineri]